MTGKLQELLLSKGHSKQDVEEMIQIVLNVNNDVNGLFFPEIIKIGGYFHDINNEEEALRVSDKVQEYLDILIRENILSSNNRGGYFSSKKASKLLNILSKP